MKIKAILLSLFVLSILWAIVSIIVNLPLLPSPWSVLLVFLNDLPRELGWHILVSCGRTIAGIVLATAVGMPLGLLLGQYRNLDKILYPLIYVTYPIPKIALLPVVILVLGIGDVSKIFLIALILFFQVLVIVRDTSRNIPAQLILSLHSLGATQTQLLRYVYLPACLPATLTSLRLNIAIAIAVLYIAESFATLSGLGFYIMDSWQQLAYDKMYAGILAMGLLGAVAFILIAYMENKLCHWTQAGKEVIGH